MDPSSSLSTYALFADLGLVLFALFLVLLNGFFVAAEFAIVRLRARAEAALGDNFDLRAFHDAILAEGSVPLPVLEQRIDAFIAKAKAD